MKGQRALAKQMEADRQLRAVEYNQDRASAKEKSVVEQDREQEYLAHKTWKASGDYRTPPPGLISLDYASPAQRQRMRERVLGQVDTGIFSLTASAANPTALAMARLNMADEQDRDAASSYEGDLRAENEYQRTGNALSLISQDWARKSGLLDTSAGMSQAATRARLAVQPESILPTILTGLLGDVAKVLSKVGSGQGGYKAANYWSSGRAATPLSWMNATPNPYSTYHR